MSKYALITGGSGYFGSKLVYKLHTQGWRCRVLDINGESGRPDGVEFLQGDIRDAKTVQAACDGVDIIFHTVAQQPLAKSQALFRSVNIQGTKNVLSAGLCAGVTKLVHMSSTAVFCVSEASPVTEQTLPRPDEEYGKTKYESERICQEYITRGLDITIIRPRTIMGHGRLGIFQILFEWVVRGANIPVLGKGDNLFQFVHADDLAEACILASQRQGPTVYNCGTDRFGTMRQTLEALCHHANTGSRVVSVPMTFTTWLMHLTSRLGLSPLGTYHALMYGRPMYFDITKASSELNWKPTYSNDEMMIESYDWYLKHRLEVLQATTPTSRHRSAINQRILALVPKLL